MPDSPTSEIIGGVGVSITGDYSDLAASFTDAQAAAKTAGEQIASNLTEGIKAAGDVTADFDEKIKALVDSGHTLAEAMATVSEGAVAGVGEALKTVGEDFKAVYQDGMTWTDFLKENMGPAMEELGSHGAAIQELSHQWRELKDATEETSGGMSNLLGELLKFGGVALSLEGLKEAATEAFAAFAREERATEALTALTGSAEQATETIEKLKSLAMSDALSFPALLNANQRMTAFGFSAAVIPGALSAVADASRAMNRDFEATSNSFERIALSGMVMPRTLASLGLAMTDLTDILGVTGKEAKKTFEALDVSDRVEILTVALNKYKGLAASTASDLTGTWQQLKTQAELSFAGVGEALKPLTPGFFNFASNAISALGSVIAKIAELGGALVRFGDNLPATVFSMLGFTEAANKWNYAMDESSGKFAAVEAQARKLFVGFPDYISAFVSLNDKVKAGAITGADYEKALKAMIAMLQALHPELKQTADVSAELQARIDAAAKAAQAHTKTISDQILSLKELTEQDREYEAAIAKAETVLARVTRLYESGRISVDVYTRAIEQLNKVTKEARGEQESLADSLQKLVDEDAKATKAANDAFVVYKEAKADLEAGTVTTGVLTLATEKLKTALEHAGIATREEIAAASDLGDLARNKLEPSLADTGNKIDLITGHLHSVTDASYGWGTSVNHVVTSLDNLGTVVKPAADATRNKAAAADEATRANKSLAEQLAFVDKNMGTLIGHTSSVRDQYGFLKDASSGVVDSIQALNDSLVRDRSDFDADAQAAYDAATAISSVGNVATQVAGRVMNLSNQLAGFQSIGEQIAKTGFHTTPIGMSLPGELGKDYVIQYGPEGEFGQRQVTVVPISEEGMNAAGGFSKFYPKGQGPTGLGPTSTGAFVDPSIHLALLNQGLGSIDSTLTGWRDSSIKTGAAAADALKGLSEWTLDTGEKIYVRTDVGFKELGADVKAGTAATAAAARALQDIPPSLSAIQIGIDSFAGSTEALAMAVDKAAVSIHNSFTSVAEALGAPPTVAPYRPGSFGPAGANITLNVTANNADAKQLAGMMVTELQRHGIRF